MFMTKCAFLLFVTITATSGQGSGAGFGDFFSGPESTNSVGDFNDLLGSLLSIIQRLRQFIESQEISNANVASNSNNGGNTNLTPPPSVQRSQLRSRNRISQTAASPTNSVARTFLQRQATTASPTTARNVRFQNQRTSGGTGASMMTLDAAQEMADAVNRFRAQNGAPPLQFDSRVRNAAHAHSIDQFNSRRLSHTGSNGSSLGSRLQQQGVPLRGAGENVAFNQRTVEQVMNAWINSPGHRRNLLNSGWTCFGFAEVGLYWTQNFVGGVQCDGVANYPRARILSELDSESEAENDSYTELISELIIDDVESSDESLLDALTTYSSEFYGKFLLI